MRINLYQHNIDSPSTKIFFLWMGIGMGITSIGALISRLFKGNLELSEFPGHWYIVIGVCLSVGYLILSSGIIKIKNYRFIEVQENKILFRLKKNRPVEKLNFNEIKKIDIHVLSVDFTKSNGGMVEIDLSNVDYEDLKAIKTRLTSLKGFLSLKM